MQKLRAVIEHHTAWKDLEVFVERIDNYVERDFSLALENAKALLETIAKEICTQKGVELGSKSSMNQLLRTAFGALDLSGSDHKTQISTSLANIGQQMGNLRNDVGTSSHGRTLEEVKDRNTKIDFLAREMLIGSTEIVGCFLISHFETWNEQKTEPVRIEYSDCSDFNDFWDEAFGEFQMGAYSFTASEVLFSVDNTAYSTEYQSFKSEGK